MEDEQAQRIRDDFRVVSSRVGDRFRVNAVGDKLLMSDGRVRYLLFFDADEPFHGSPRSFNAYQRFDTPNGFHIVASYLGSPKLKDYWWMSWKCNYPDSDYLLNNWNWLGPHSQRELDYILWVASPTFPKVVRYYRDKRVFEEYAKA